MSMDYGALEDAAKAENSVAPVLKGESRQQRRYSNMADLVR